MARTDAYRRFADLELANHDLVRNQRAEGASASAGATEFNLASVGRAYAALRFGQLQAVAKTAVAAHHIDDNTALSMENPHGLCPRDP